MSEQEPSPPAGGDVRAITSLGELQACCATLATQARRSLDIASRDLEPRLYDQAEFLAAVRQLAVSGRQARVRILLHDVAAAVQADHRLIELARRLSSFIEIRRFGPDDSEFNRALLISDEAGFVHRTLADRFEGQCSLHSPRQARELAREFQGLWDRSESDINLRRLHL